MKLPSIIYCIVLGLAPSVQAQEKATNPNQPSKPTTPAGQFRSVSDPAINIGTDANRTIHIELNGGRLADAIAEVESHVKRGGAGAQPMPHLIYSGVDVPDLAMSGKSRMAGVTPVQAVALVCAAAGCTLEPIFAPAEGTSSSEAVQKIIGYRIVRDSAQHTFLSASKPTTFTGTGGVEKIKSDIAAATAKLIELRAQYTATHPSVIAGEKELVKLQRALEQNTVESKRRGDLFSATQAGGVGSNGGGVGGFAPVTGGGVGANGGGVGGFAPASQSSVSSRRGSMGSSPQAATSADAAERVVRVYALGSLIAKIGENSSVDTHETQKRRSELIRDTENLIGQTLSQAELTAGKSPDFFFNEGLRVLVAKATEAQHEIISQIIQALKENETYTAQTAKPAPSAETILPTPTPTPSAEKPKSNP